MGYMVSVYLVWLGFFFFFFLRNFQTTDISQSVCTILHFYQQCMNDPVSPHLQQHLVLSAFLFLYILVVLMGV